MSFDTYANLQAEILAKINRAGDSDAVTRCPSWITLAEDEMRMALTRLMVRQGETKDSTFAISSEYTALPSGFFRIRNIKINGSPTQNLDYVTPEVADNWDVYGDQNKPRLYTIQNNQLRVYPAPDTPYTATFTYFALPSLSVANTTNWLLTAHPKIYFKSALAEAYDYYDNDNARDLAQSDRDRMFDAIYKSDGSDQQGANLKTRVDGATP